MDDEQSARALAHVVSRIRDVSPRLGAGLDAELTVLQRDVLAAMNGGESASAIARRLDVSEPTVKAEWSRGNRAIEDFMVTTADPEGVIDSLLNGQTALRQARASAQADGERAQSHERRTIVARAALHSVREDLRRERASLPHGV